jgi:uncharacterized protein
VTDITMWATAFIMGLFSSAHCIGMCGGIIGALTLAGEKKSSHKRWLLVGLYNVGRIFSYIVIALLFYFLIDTLETYFAWAFMRVIAGLLLIAMGLYLANWWRGLVYLEKLGSYVWHFLQPLSRSLIPVKNYWQAFFLGTLWGWLPCGLIYSALVYAATSSSMFSAGMTMFAFALGTLPAVLAMGLLTETLRGWIKHKISTMVMAILMIVFGIWVLYGEFSGHHHAASIVKKSIVNKPSQTDLLHHH